jgi:O-antigen ligase/tetratricopeptide (TPR) repeat protein
MTATVERQDIRTSVYCRALEITWLAIIFLIPLFFNPQSHNVFAISKASLLQFLVVVMLALWLADWIMNSTNRSRLNWRNIISSPLHLPILIFGLLYILSTAASITPAISFWGSYFRKEGLLTMLCWILFFLIVAQQIRNRAQIFRAIYTLLLSSGIVSVLGILQYFIPDAMFNVFHIAYPGRAFSTAGNPLFLSSFLAMVIPINLALIINSWNKGNKGKNTIVLTGLVILLALQFWCLWLAQYSITILLFIIAPVIFLIILGIVRRKRLILSLGAVSLLILGIIAGWLLIPLLFTIPKVETPGSTQNMETVPIADKLGLETLGWRVEYWRNTIDLLRESPEVPFSNDRLLAFRRFIGYGPETFIVTFQLFFPKESISEYTQRSELVDRPHNHYLYLAATIGLLGLMSFLSILAVFFYLCFRYLRRTTTDIDRLLLIAMVAGMVQYMVDILFNPSSIPPELVFWLILALVPVIGRFIQNNEPTRTEIEETARTENDTASYITRTRFFLSLGCVMVLIYVGTIITVRPFLADTYLQKGLNLQRAGNEQAIYAFDKATRLDPGDAAYWHALGEHIYSVAQRVNEKPLKEEMLTLATDAYNKSLALRPYIALEHYSTADVYTYWAWTGAIDKWPTALSLYDEASQLFPDNAVILNKWSLALISKGDLNEARTKLDYTTSIDPDWAETSFLSGLLLTREGENVESALKIIAPIQNESANLDYFVDLCTKLTTYYMLKPLQNALDAYVAGTPEEWAGHAVLGVTNLYTGDLTNSLVEFNTAVLIAPDKNVADVFQAIIRLSATNRQFKAALPNVAVKWQDKLSRSPEWDTLSPAFDRLAGGTK